MNVPSHNVQNAVYIVTLARIGNAVNAPSDVEAVSKAVVKIALKCVLIAALEHVQNAVYIVTIARDGNAVNAPSNVNVVSKAVAKNALQCVVIAALEHVKNAVNIVTLARNGNAVTTKTSTMFTDTNNYLLRKIHRRKEYTTIHRAYRIVLAAEKNIHF